jgi:hypothetical protein
MGAGREMGSGEKNDQDTPSTEDNSPGRRRRIVYRAGELPDEFIEAIKKARPPAEAWRFDEEMDDH